MSTKSDFMLPVSNQDFVRDVKSIFQSSDEDIIKLTQEIKNKGDSFNSVNASNLIETDIDSIEVYKGVALYLNHLLYAHDVHVDEIKDQIIKMGIDKNKVQSYISELAKFNEQEKARIEALYQANITPQDLYIADIDYTHTYLSVNDEKGDFLGLSPNLRINVELNNINDDKEVVSFQANLDDLNQIIRKFEEIYFMASEESKKLKQQSKVICIPEDQV